MQDAVMMPFFVSIKLALFTTAVLFAVSLPLSYYLGMNKGLFKIIIESFVSMPLILPPTVLGFYLLVMFSPRSSFGGLFEKISGSPIIFSFAGILTASCIHSLPFMTGPIKNGIENFDRKIIEASYAFGKNRFVTFFKVILPNMKKNIFTACITTFAHVMGEFGVILMVGGNIPGRTKTASIAIYEKVEQLKFSEANLYSLIFIALAYLILFLTNIVNAGKGKKT